MSEGSPKDSDALPPDWTDLIDEVVERSSLKPIAEAFDFMVESPTYRDSRIKAYALAARYMLAADERMAQSFEFMQYMRQQRGRPTPPLYAANLSLRAAQHILRQRPDYARLSKTSAGWIEALDTILGDSEGLHYDFDALLCTNEIQTNVPGRYMGPKLVMALYASRFNGPINYLDVGCSIGVGTKALILDEVRQPVRVVMPTPDNPLFEQENVSNYINAQLDRPIEFAQSAGVDILGVRDLAQIEWTKSCFYPSEVAENQEIIGKYERLAHTEVPQLTFHRADFADNDSVDEFLSEAPVKQFDVISIVTMMHQLRRDERKRVIRNAKRLLLPGGLIVIQDFAKVDPSKTAGLDFFDVWPPYSYRTIVMDETSDGGQPVELFWWKNGRCEEVIIGPTGNELYVEGLAP